MPRKSARALQREREERAAEEAARQEILRNIWARELAELEERKAKEAAKAAAARAAREAAAAICIQCQVRRKKARSIMAAARRRAKKEARRQAYISAFGRAPTEAATCHVSGVGLSQALVLQEAHFIIEACDDTGARQVTGGDVFTVAVRMASQGTRVRARVSDRGDGTYRVSYKSATSGPCSISVSMMNEPLPGSPFTCHVSGSTPAADMCILKGLRRAIASRQEHFSVGFRDFLGQVSNSEELDVFVRPVDEHHQLSAHPAPAPSHSPASVLSSTDSRASSASPIAPPRPASPSNETLHNAGLVKPLKLCPHESLIVVKPLTVFRSIELDSERIGQVLPRRLLRVLRVETILSPRNHEVVRACIELEDDDYGIHHGQESWRAAYAQRPSWRTPSFRRFHLEVEDDVRNIVTATKMDLPGRRHARQEGTRLEGSAHLCIPDRSPEEPDRHEDKGASLKPAPEPAPSPAASETITPTAAPSAPAAAGRATSYSTASRSDAKGKAPPDGARATKDASTSSAVANAPVAALAPADRKGKSKKSSTKGEGTLRGALEATKKKSTKLKTSSSGATSVTTSAPQSEREDVVDPEVALLTSGFVLEPRSLPVEALAPAPARFKPLGNSRTSPPKPQSPGRHSDGHLHEGDYKHERLPEVGWVSIDIGGLLLVEKQLKSHVRQQHLQQYDRNRRLDQLQEEERDRSMMQEELNCRLALRLATSTGLGSRNSSPPRSALLRLLDADPSGIGFAYGGVDPGRLHAHDHDFHKVHFSICRAGAYLLHCGLRRPNGSIPLPGSPFLLKVDPGAAYALTTRIPDDVLPLSGALELTLPNKAETGAKSEPRCICTLNLQARDRMGNACTQGGATVVCGCTDAESGVVSRTIDQGNGLYACEWWSVKSGNYEVYVKMDGLHVINSPARMRLSSGTPDYSQTKVHFEMLSRAGPHIAGKEYKLRLMLRDVHGNPALPGPTVCFYCASILPAEVNEDKEAWRRLEPLVCSQNLVGHEVELTFSPQLAGDTRLYLWTLTEEAQRRADRAACSGMPIGVQRRAAGRAALNSNEEAAAIGQRMPGKATMSSYDLDRRALPGSPFGMYMKPSEPSPHHSRIDSLLINAHGKWEETNDPSVIRAGGPKSKAPPTGTLINYIQVGDTVRFQPSVADQFGNAIFTSDSILSVFVKGQAGPESDEHLHVQMLVDKRGGGGSFDVRYEIRRRGRHVLHAMINGKHIIGSPFEWHAIPCRPDGRRWEPGERESAEAAALQVA